MQSPEWIAVLAPFASGALGVGMAYGLIKARVDALCDRLDRDELHLDKQVGEGRCKEYRNTCRDEWKEDVARLEGKINGYSREANKRP